jgi:hypothetical protein
MAGMWRFEIDLTEPQYEVLRAVTRASGDTVQEWLQTCVIQGLESDIELYFGTSEAITKDLNSKLQLEKAELQ